MVSEFRQKSTKNVVIPLDKDNLPGLVSNLASDTTNLVVKKAGKIAVREGKGSALVILNEDMNDIIKIIKSLEDSNVLIDGIPETVKHEIKNKKVVSSYFVSTLATSLAEPVISSVVKGISGRGVRRAGIGYMEKIS